MVERPTTRLTVMQRFKAYRARRRERLLLEKPRFLHKEIERLSSRSGQLGVKISSERSAASSWRSDFNQLRVPRGMSSYDFDWMNDRADEAEKRAASMEAEKTALDKEIQRLHTLRPDTNSQSKQPPVVDRSGQPSAYTTVVRDAEGRLIALGKKG